MSTRGPLEVYFAENNGKLMFSGGGYCTGFGCGKREDFDLRLTVEKTKEPVDGLKTRAGYYNILLLRSYAGNTNSLVVGPKLLDLFPLEMASRGQETYNNMGKRVFGTDVLTKDIKVATFGNPRTPVSVHVEETLDNLPDMVRLEVLTGLEKMERVTRGGVDVNLMGIGKAQNMSERDNNLFTKMEASNGRWSIGQNEETFDYRFNGVGDIYKITSELVFDK